jgi:glucokinase
VDVGGTNIRAAALDHQLTKLAQAQRRMDKSSPGTVLEGIARCVEQVVHASEHTVGIGVAMKGLVDHEQGVMVVSTTLRMEGLPVKAFLEDRFGFPAAVDNDVHAATIGEIYYGAGRRLKNFVYLNVGTGIAAGLVFDGRLYRGAVNQSGEFGHSTVDLHGRPCPQCAMRGCIEDFASGPAIVRRAREGLAVYPCSSLVALAQSGQLSATDVFRAAEERDGLAQQVLEETVEYLGAAVVNLVNLLNPEAIILGGGVFSGADIFATQLADFVTGHAMEAMVPHLKEIVPSTLGVNDVGLIGGASLIWEYRDLYPPV